MAEHVDLILVFFDPIGESAVCCCRVLAAVHLLVGRVLPCVPCNMAGVQSTCDSHCYTSGVGVW
jgi:hypothetical protein